MEKRQKITLAEAHDLAGRIAEMLALAVEAEAKERENVKARVELENLVNRNEQLKSENATLQAQLEDLKKEHGGYATLEQKTKHLRELDKALAERTAQLRRANQDLTALRQKFDVAS
jgi:uncharacterized protein (UPF0335 family)